MYRFRRTFLQDKNGISLLEVVLVTSIAGLALALLMHCYAMGFKGSIRGKSRIDAQQNGRIVMHEVTRELRYATAIYDKNKTGRKKELLMPYYGDGEGGGVTRLFLTGPGGQEREIKFNEAKRSVTLRQGSGPDNEIGYDIKKLEFFWYIPSELSGENVFPQPNMVFILLESQEVDPKGNPRSSSPYILHNTVHLKNIKW